MKTHVRCYRYGLHPPTGNIGAVWEQMKLAHRYRNQLTEIERARRAAVRDLIAQAGATELARLGNVVDAALAEVSSASLAIRAARAETRSRSETTEARRRLTEAKAKHKQAVSDVRLYRKGLRSTIRLETDVINDRAHELQLSARAHRGSLYWGSYLLVERAAAQAFKDTPLYDKDGVTPKDPRFARWRGQGRIGVQLQGGLAKELALCGQDTQLRIVTGLADGPNSKGGRRSGRCSLLYARIDSVDRGKPVWAVFPMLMHRPLPAGAVIKELTVTIVKRGPRHEWSACLTVQEPALVSCGDGAVAVDVGWRLIGDQIRVAAWRGEDGDTGELRLPGDLLSALSKAESLQAIRDRNFNAARDELVKWARDNDGILPDWLREVRAHLWQWRSQARLRRLALTWRSARFDGDGVAYEALEKWRYHDHHLWTWEENQRIKALRRRREFYRIFAAWLAARYDTVVFEDFDLRRVAQRAAPGESENENEVARHNRHKSAISEFRSVTATAFKVRGGREAKVPAPNTTRTCAACGHVDKWDQAARIRHRCTKCGADWDQDENAAENILNLWIDRERGGGEQNSVSAREDGIGNGSGTIKESRWERARRLKTEKDARKETAREDDAKLPT